MAKRKVYIDVIVDDKGTTKRIAIDSKKLKRELEGVSEGSEKVTRSQRGLAQTASSGSKNFANLASASGGLVSAYAILAAQIFAVTAAFGFLREAANVRNLITAQEQYGAVTGTSFKGITEALQEATEGQLKYKEAAQSTAIASAAGLSKDQITGLGVAAKNASLVLGRDLTDSFNRLVKGVTKAEPELLDELGIILRLKPATEEYAAAIGKTAEDLNAFERSQAVANFVLEEAENKFGIIAKTMDRDAFAVERFAKSFDDLINTIKKGIMPVVIPVLNFLSENTLALASAFALVALPITKAMLPAFDEMADSMQDSVDIAKKSASQSAEAFESATASISNSVKTRKGAFDEASRAAAKAGISPEKPGSGGETGLDFLTGASSSKKAQANANRILKNAEDQVNDSARKRTGILKKYNKQQLADLRASYELRAQAVKKFEMRAVFSMKTVNAAASSAAKGAVLAWRKASLAMIKTTQLLARGMNKAMAMAGWLGIIMMVFELGKTAYNALFPMSEEAKRAAKEVENLSSKYEGLNEHLTKIHELNSNNPGLLSGTEILIQQGNALEQANVLGLLQDIEKLDGLKGTKGFEGVNEGIRKTIDSLIHIDPIFKSLLTDTGELVKLDSQAKKALVNRANAMVQAGAAAEQLAQSSKNVSNELTSIINSIPQAPLQTLQEVLDQDYELKAKVALETPRSQEIQNQIASLDEAIAKAKKGTNIQVTEEKVFNTRANGTRTGTTRTNKVTTYTQTDADKQDVKDLQKKKDALIASDNAAAEAADKALKARNFIRSQVAKQLKIEDDIRENRLEIAQIDKVSKSFEAKKSRLKAADLQAENNVSKAKQKQQSLITSLLLISEEDVKTQAASYQNALRAVQVAGEEVAIAEALEIAQKAITAEKERQLDIQARQITEARNLMELENTQAANARDRLMAVKGVGGAGLSAGDMGALKRAQEMETFEEQIRTKEMMHENALTAQKDLQGTQDAAAIQAADARVQKLENEIALLNVKKQINEDLEQILLAGEERELKSLERKREELTMNPVLAEFYRVKAEHEAAGAGHTEEALQNLYETVKAQEEVKLVTQGVTGIQNAFVDSLSAGIEGIITGTMTMKDAFKNMAMSVLGMIAKMITQMLVFRMLSSMMPGGGAGGAGAGGAGNLANLEIFQGSGSGLFPGLRRGGIVKGYATGGIARGRNAGYPAILHGTEAVVPLPSGGKIPVEMKNGAGDTNNVSINVNMSNDGSAQTESQSDGKQGADIGKLLASVVQEELQKQKRPGGILSPYGAA